MEKSNKKAADRFSYPEYLQLLEEGKIKTEIMNIFSMSRASFYKYLKMAEQKNDASKENCRNQAELDNVEDAIIAHFDRIDDMLASTSHSSQDLESFRDNARRLRYEILSNLADASCLAKKLSAYLKSTETT